MAHRFLSKKTVGWTVAAIVVFGLSAAYVFPRLKIIIPLRYKYSRDAAPHMYRVPRIRTVSAAVETAGGFEYGSGKLLFRVPTEAIRTLDTEFARAFVFAGSKVVIVSNQKKGEGVLDALLGDHPDQAEAMHRFWGSENLQSEYALVKGCLYATPDKGGIFTSKTELLRLPSMLLLKAVYSPLGSVVYQFETEHVRGFQFGDPRNSPEVFVYLFDRSDRLFRIKLAMLDQVEIDSLLASISITPANGDLPSTPLHEHPLQEGS